MIPHSRVFESAINGFLNEDNRHKIERVLRLRAGDTFFITNGCGKEAEVVLEKNGEYSVKKMAEPNREPDLEVTLFAALSKGDRIEWIIEKAVEVGVRRIIPTISERCIVKDPSKAKLERWQKIAESAMLQCGGCILPKIEKPLKLGDTEVPSEDVLPILLHEEDLEQSSRNLKDKDFFKKVWLASGPEGGFADSEVDFLKNRGWKAFWLGKRLFRMDTAPIFALSNILSPHLF